jgi:spore coat polysaccharide biosynthesis protein SpsF
MTEQEKFWENKFGDDYIERNSDRRLLLSKIVLFSKILRRIGPIDSVIEFGCNIGLNLDAITFLIPKIQVTGIEINSKACESLKKKNLKHFNESFLSESNYGQFDLSFTKGVLIHTNPDKLKLAYKKLYSSSRKYILIAEYYNPSPVSLEYRGQKDKLFKRDFAGELLEMYPDLKLIDYGFTHHLDAFPDDDTTWFLLEKELLN